MILVYITNPNKKTALKIARHLLVKKLIACANIFSTDSLYFWRGKNVQTKETILLAKTDNKNFTKIKQEVAKIHPYDLPCIIKLKAEANPAFAAWVKSEVI